MNITIAILNIVKITLVCYNRNDYDTILTFLVGLIRVVVWGLGGSLQERRWIFNILAAPKLLFFNTNILIIIQLASCLIGLGSILMHVIEHTSTASNYRSWILLIASTV